MKPSTMGARRVLRVQVVQMDQRPLARFVAAIGDVYSRGRGSATRKSFVGGPDKRGMSRVCFTSAVAERAMTRLYPYLSEPKREQADAAWLRVCESRGWADREPLWAEDQEGSSYREV